MNNETALTPQQEKLSVARPELNLEKWPGLFIPAQSRSKAKVKTLERKKALENGSISISKVKVNPSLEYGNLTTEDYKVFLGLILIWEETERLQGFYFSLRELNKKLGSSWGGKQWDTLIKSLSRLSSTTLTWINSYFDSRTKKTLELLESFHILSELKIAKVINKHSVNDEKCYCKFSDMLYQNLLNNHTKPTFLNVVLGFKSGVAQILYKYLELVMHNKTNYERNSKELFFVDLGLEGEEYKKPSARKRILQTAVDEVNGKPIQNGILEITLVKTKDGLDWKIVVVKLPQMSLFEGGEKVEPEQLTTLLPNESKPAPQSPLSLAGEIIVFFLQKFHIKRKTPLKKELLTARQWIDQYNLDLEKAQVFISKCKVWAAETDFDIQNFAGLQQYLDRTTEIFQQMEVNRAIKICTLCDDNGYVEGKEQNGREFSLKCMHDVNQLQTYANKHKVQVMLKDRSIIQGE